MTTKMGAVLLLAGVGAVLPALATVPAPLSYPCLRAIAPIHIDGKLDDAAWRNAPWTADFVDIEGDSKPRPKYRTRVKMLWDDQYLYIAAEMEEPDVKATLTQRDSVIFKDNDFEVFIKPLPDTDSYYEFEINALNTGWDLFLPKPYNQDGQPDNSWDIQGLKTAIAVQGTLNNPKDKDRGWSVEIAYPLSAFASRQAVPQPRDGTTWRINFSRVEWTTGKPKEDNWVWSPQGVIDMHVPERWGFLQFLGRATMQKN
nr:carbohydrate-binding family 9-like protein [uncultured Duganella sp.]